jgi:hypothetical protein
MAQEVLLEAARGCAYYTEVRENILNQKRSYKVPSRLLFRLGAGSIFLDSVRREVSSAIQSRGPSNESTIFQACRALLN